MGRVIRPDEVSLGLVREADNWLDCRLLLEVTDGEGKQTRIHLDGLQAADLILDALECGAPLEWKGPPVPGHSGTGWGQETPVHPPSFGGRVRKMRPVAPPATESDDVDDLLLEAEIGGIESAPPTHADEIAESLDEVAAAAMDLAPDEITVAQTIACAAVVLRDRLDQLLDRLGAAASGNSPDKTNSEA